MAVEIGSLVVRALFGSAAEGTETGRITADELARLRRELLDEVQDMIAEAERRARER